MKMPEMNVGTIVRIEIIRPFGYGIRFFLFGLLLKLAGTVAPWQTNIKVIKIDGPEGAQEGGGNENN